MNRSQLSAPCFGLIAFLSLWVSAASLSTLAQAQNAGSSHVHHATCGCAACRAHADQPHAYQIGGDHEEPAGFRTFGSGWTSTASGSSGTGQPATLTWSIVPDGTTLPGNFVNSSGSSNGVNEPSDLISFLDGLHHAGNSPGGSDLTQRSWWQLINSSFQRWDELSALKFIYEPNDDGVNLASRSGILGARGDHRIGGHSLDGQTSPTILAFNYFPNNADMVIDTDEINRWGNPAGNYLRFRNMLMHEIGHGLGLQHVESSDINPETPRHDFGTFLMEPFLSTVFDGPQFDDILGIHRLYGDQNEEDGGNGTYQRATMLGGIQGGQTLSIGTDADDVAVAPGDTDFVSIHDESDVDYFKFSITSPQIVDITLTPMGPTYEESAQNGTLRPFVSAQKSNLGLTLFDSSGTFPLGSSNLFGLGLSESISGVQLSTPGDYFVRVTGSTFNQAQFFQLDITAVPEPTALALASFSLVVLTAKRRRAS